MTSSQNLQLCFELRVAAGNINPFTQLVITRFTFIDFVRMVGASPAAGYSH
jgi:hypothetical protein